MTSKKKRPSKPQSQVSKRLAGVFIVVIALLVIVVFGKYYFEKTVNREKLAGYLPADRTVAILEFNLSSEREDAQELLQLALKNPVISQSTEILESIIPNKSDFNKWYSNRGGIAVLSSANEQDFKPVVFLGKSNQDSAADWISSLALKPENDLIMDEQFYGQKLISYQSGQNIQILWTDDFLIFSEQREPLEAIAQTLAGNKNSLRTMPVYNQIASALPEQNLGFIYLNRSKLLEVLNKNQEFLAGRLAIFKLYFPFLNIFSEEGMAIQLKHDAKQNPILTAEHLSLFNAANANQPLTKDIEYFYDGKLEKILPGDISFYAGGSNLLDQKNRLQSYLQSSAGANGIIFEGLINALEDNLSNPGANANIEDNLFSSLKENYLFYMDSKKDEMPRFGLIVESDKPENDILKLKKAVTVFGPKFAAPYLAKSTPMTLPDGTRGTELTAEIGVPTTKKIQISGQKMEQITFTPEFSVFLWADHQEKILIITNSQADMQIMLEKQQSEEVTIADYGLDKPTEVYYLDINRITQAHPDLANLIPLKYLRAARKITPIGIISSYELGL